MSRRRKAESRRDKILPDAKYNSRLVSQLVNAIMKDGKKSVAEKIVYSALETIKKQAKTDDVLGFLKDAVGNISPAVKVLSRRIGGATYQIPMEVNSVQRVVLAIRWLVLYARKRSEHGMPSRLAGELMDANNNRGMAVKKREDTHKMAEANKAFAHFR